MGRRIIGQGREIIGQGRGQGRVGSRNNWAGSCCNRAGSCCIVAARAESVYEAGSRVVGGGFIVYCELNHERRVPHVAVGVNVLLVGGPALYTL